MRYFGSIHASYHSREGSHPTQQTKLVKTGNLANNKIIIINKINNTMNILGKTSLTQLGIHVRLYNHNWSCEQTIFVLRDLRVDYIAKQ